MNTHRTANNYASDNTNELLDEEFDMFDIEQPFSHQNDNTPLSSSEETWDDQFEATNMLERFSAAL